MLVVYYCSLFNGNVINVGGLEGLHDHLRDDVEALHGGVGGCLIMLASDSPLVFVCLLFVYLFASWYVLYVLLLCCVVFVFSDSPLAGSKNTLLPTNTRVWWLGPKRTLIREAGVSSKRRRGLRRNVGAA